MPSVSPGCRGYCSVALRTARVATETATAEVSNPRVTCSRNAAASSPQGVHLSRRKRLAAERDFRFPDNARPWAHAFDPVGRLQAKFSNCSLRHGNRSCLAECRMESRSHVDAWRERKMTLNAYRRSVVDWAEVIKNPPAGIASVATL